MTIEQLLVEYKKQFIIVVETVGEILKNDSYKRIEEILNKRASSGEDQMLEQNAPFGVFVVFYISLLLADIYGPEEVSSWNDVTERKECRDFYHTYLEDFTDKFTQKYGLEKVNIEKIRFLFRLV